MRTVPTDRTLGPDDLHVLDSPKGDDAPAPRVPGRVSFKPRPCKTCRRIFTPDRFGKVCCSPSCAISYSRRSGPPSQSAASKRVRAAERKEQKAAVMTLSKIKNLAQREVNRYIRERDYLLGCISCNAPQNYDGQWTAGHYRTTKAADHLRFHEDNLAKQCGQCNYHKSGNIGEFRLGLIERIGIARVEAIENNNETKRWEREELHAIRRDYLNRWKTLKAAREQA